MLKDDPKVLAAEAAVRGQRQWIAEHGGDEAGYVERYGSWKERRHYGEGGERIYEADMLRLRECLSELDVATGVKRCFLDQMVVVIRPVERPDRIEDWRYFAEEKYSGRVLGTRAISRAKGFETREEARRVSSNHVAAVCRASWQGFPWSEKCSGEKVPFIVSVWSRARTVAERRWRREDRRRKEAEDTVFQVSGLPDGGLDELLG